MIVYLFLALYVIGLVIILTVPPTFTKDEQKIIKDSISQNWSLGWDKQLVLKSKLQMFFDTKQIVRHDDDR